MMHIGLLIGFIEGFILADILANSKIDDLEMELSELKKNYDIAIHEKLRYLRLIESVRKKVNEMYNHYNKSACTCSGDGYCKPELRDLYECDPRTCGKSVVL